MRKRYLIRQIDGEWKAVEGEATPRVAGPQIIPDIYGYKSTVTGEWIGSRRAHREHLKRHGLVEVGNSKWPERKPVPMPDLKPDLVPIAKEVLRRARQR